MRASPMTSVVRVVLLTFLCLCRADLRLGDTSNSNINTVANCSVECYAFCVGNETKQEFYSPGYPGNYTNITNCYRILNAGEKSIVKISFLGDYFEIEPSKDCEHDYLRFIDGLPNDSSNELRRECGYVFPREISSCGQNMTIHFHSDGNIQRRGFKAKYEFIQVEASCKIEKATLCSHTLNNLSGKFGTKDMPPKTVLQSVLGPDKPLLCTWQFEIPDLYKVAVSFEKFQLPKPNECKANYLEIFNRSATDVMIKSTSKQFCGVVAETITELVNTAMVNLHATAGNKNWEESVDFSAIYTAYTVKTSAALCHPGFYCGDKTCLDISLKCNGVPNCKDRSDESEDECNISQVVILTNTRIVILVPIVIGSILASMCYLYKRCKGRDKSGLDTVCGTSSTMRANSLASGLSGRFGRTNIVVLDSPDMDLDDDPDSTGCYVPEVDLAEFHKRFNGCHTLPLIHPMCHEETPLELPPPPPPPPPHFHPPSPPLSREQSQILADFEPDFPPPPPIYYNFDAAFKTRVPKEDLEAEQVFGVPSTGEPHCMQPRSFESVKSAPDII